VKINEHILQPQGDRPADVHPGQQPPSNPSTSEQSNQDKQRREMTSTGDAIAPQRQETQNAPLFAPSSAAKVSPTQSPNDGGRKSVVPG
jgi:hypothetical protein